MKSKLGLFSNGSISSSLFLMETNLIRFLFFIFFSWNTCSVSLFVSDGILNTLHCIHAKRCHRSHCFSCILCILFTTCFCRSFCPSSGTYNTIMMLEKCLAAPIVDYYLCTSKHQTMTPIPRDAARGLRALFLVCFSTISCEMVRLPRMILQFWPSVTHARCYIFMELAWL